MSGPSCAPLRPLQFGRTAVVSDARLTPPPLEGKSVTRFEFSPFCTFPHGGHVFFASARFPPLTAPTRPQNYTYESSCGEIDVNRHEPLPPVDSRDSNRA